jgi:hypothetical protein
MKTRQFLHLPPMPGCFSIVVGILAVLVAKLYARPRQVQASGQSEVEYNVGQSECGETAGP